MPGLSLKIGLELSRGRASRPYGTIDVPSSGFAWTVGDVVTISGTCEAVAPATVADVEVRIRGNAIAESTVLGPGGWTVDHTVVEADEYAIAVLTAHITDSEGRAADTLPITGIIYPVDGDGYTYFYDSATGEFLVDSGEFVIEP